MTETPEDSAPAPAESAATNWFGRLGHSLTGPGGWQTLAGLLKLFAFILLLKGCVIDQYSIPSESMEPTLHGDDRFFRGDRILVNKWVYGPRIPFTTVRLWDWAPPERWDIVVFVPKSGTSEHPRLVKRIVGLPGERVRIAEGGIEINGERIALPDSLPPNQFYINQDDIRHKAENALTVEEQARWNAYLSLYPLKYGVLEEEGYQRVPEDHYFLLGDNSVYSADSRVFGFVPRDHLLGRAFAIWWPFSRRRDFTGFSHTWWGMALLYGIPLLVVAYEVSTRLRRRG